jgi:hypothetical protein
MANAQAVQETKKHRGAKSANVAWKIILKVVPIANNIQMLSTVKSLTISLAGFLASFFAQIARLA